MALNFRSANTLNGLSLRLSAADARDSGPTEKTILTAEAGASGSSSAHDASRQSATGARSMKQVRT